jgi:hypothetical protein
MLFGNSKQRQTTNCIIPRAPRGADLCVWGLV